VIRVETYWDAGGSCWVVLGCYEGDVPEALAFGRSEDGAWELAQRSALAAGVPAIRRDQDGSVREILGTLGAWGQA
jgi:hypothetical protein